MISFRAVSKATVGLMALLGVGVVASAEGCGPGDSRYYCDNTGCFSCDGYGCSPVAAPTPQTCTGNKACSAGETCTDKGCLLQCKTDPDCVKGTVCLGGFCQAPGSTTPPTPKQCTTKTDCNAGEQCASGTCEACGGTAGPCACTVTADCASGEQCSGGVCVATSNLCKYSSDCGGQGKVCADGQCLIDCSAGQTCPSGLSCQKGVCAIDPNAKPECTSNAQCSGATPECVSGKCTAQCTTATPCGTGFYCEQGACLVDNRPTPNCTANGNECKASQVCKDGFCKYPCADDNTCKLIDARIGYCGVDKVCRSADEAAAQCTSSSQCPANQSCIANSCK